MVHVVKVAYMVEAGTHVTNQAASCGTPPRSDVYDQRGDWQAHFYLFCRPY